MSTDFGKIDDLIKEWKAAQPLPQEVAERLDQKLRLEINYNSNHLEGNTLTYGETELLIISGQTHGTHSIRDLEEMKAHDVALRHIQELSNQTEPIREGDIRDLNKLILKESFWKPAITESGQDTRKWIIPGDYKTSPNNVRTETGEIFFYAKPTDVPAMMEELVQWVHLELTKPTCHPVEFAARLHHQFLAIHPFDDGNGRAARLLANYVFLKAGYPLLIVKSSDKKSYLSALHVADVGDCLPLIEFMAQQVTWSLELALKAARGESLEEVSDIEKEVALYVKQQINGQTEVIKKSRDATLSFYTHSLLPLFQSIERKAGQLSPLFAETVFTALVEGNARADMKWTESVMNLLPQMGSANSLQFTTALKGYKGSQPFSLDHSVDVYLQEFELTVFFDRRANKGQIRKLYSEFILREEIEEISASVLKQLFEGVKANQSTSS